jgi:hypothetical protein
MKVTKETGAAESVVKLTCTKSAHGRNNYATWLAYVNDTLSVEFGPVASVMKTNVAYTVPELTPTDYLPADLPAGMVLTDANQREL